MYAPNLYTHFGLDPQENSTALGVLLSARDARLSQQGYPTSADTRRETNIGYGILGNDEARALYDEALRAGRGVTWAQLQYLCDFGTWPQDYTGWTEPDHDTDAQAASAPQPHQHAQPGPAQNPYGQYAQPDQPAVNPYGSSLNFAHTPGVGPNNIVPSPAHPVWGQPTGVVDYGAVAQRAKPGTRWAMGIVDGFLATVVGGVVLSPLSVFGDNGDAIAALLFFVVFSAYFILPEVLWGGSPIKLAAGYQVRDVDTHARLSPQQAMKRNWFRLVNIVPGLGQLVGFIGGLISVGTISPDNGMLGAHDRFAHAEVVKRSPRR